MPCVQNLRFGCRLSCGLDERGRPRMASSSVCCRISTPTLHEDRELDAATASKLDIVPKAGCYLLEVNAPMACGFLDDEILETLASYGAICWESIEADTSKVCYRVHVRSDMLCDLSSQIDLARKAYLIGFAVELILDATASLPHLAKRNLAKELFEQTLRQAARLLPRVFSPSYVKRIRTSTAYIPSLAASISGILGRAAGAGSSITPNCDRIERELYCFFRNSARAPSLLHRIRSSIEPLPAGTSCADLFGESCTAPMNDIFSSIDSDAKYDGSAAVVDLFEDACPKFNVPDIFVVDTACSQSHDGFILTTKEKSFVDLFEC